MKDWLTAGMSCIMLPAALRLNKYMWLMFFIFLFLSFLCLGFLLTPLAGKNCWRTSSGTRTTVWETVILRIGKLSSYVAYVVPNNCIKTRYKFSLFCISGLQCLQILF